MASQIQAGPARSSGPPSALVRARVGAVRTSVISNAGLTSLKLLAWAYTGSVSVLSETVHSALDLSAAVMAFLAVRKSGQPADADHQFGHGKFESLSGFVEGALIMAAVAMIAWGSLHRLFVRHPLLTSPSLGLAAMAVSAVVNIFVSRLLFRVAREADSVALEADAWHLRTDVWTSAGVFGGLGVIAVARRLGTPSAEMLDPLVALGVAAVIARAAWDIMHRSWGHLVDRSLPPEEINLIESLLGEHYPQLSSYHQLRTRKAGPQRYIDLHLVVAGEQSVSDAHSLCDHLEADLRAMLPRAEVMIHVEPKER